MPQLVSLSETICIVSFSLLHFMFWCGDPGMSKNMFKVCVKIYIYNVRYIFRRVQGSLIFEATFISHSGHLW